MHGNLPTPAPTAIIADGNNAAREILDGKSAADDDGQWFSRAARRLHPTKPGSILHYTTALGDERLCQRYASGEVKPPAYFLRALLRSEHGRQWLYAIMDGCQSEWWIEFQRHARMGAAADKESRA
jgi:hypothetical protein